MNGQEIFNFTIEKVPGLIEKILKKNNFTIEEIDYFIFHQANKYMLEYLRKKIRIPSEKFHNNTLLSGNTVSSTIPIALKESMNLNIIKPGDKVLLAGFGVGYSWGATILEI
jgi:3-oxoacyl-[acyl-carrier-protein] synthase-3